MPKKKIVKKQIIKKKKTNLKKTSTKAGIFKACQTIFYEANFTERLNVNPLIIVFNNGVYDFEIRQCWGATYKGHEWLMEHNHFPWTLSFVYYVSMPKDASGLMMGDDEIEMYEGDCIFFLGSQYHGVRPSHTMNDTRCVIAGNILYVQS